VTASSERQDPRGAVHIAQGPPAPVWCRHRGDRAIGRDDRVAGAAEGTWKSLPAVQHDLGAYAWHVSASAGRCRARWLRRGDRSVGPALQVRVSGVSGGDVRRAGVRSDPAARTADAGAAAAAGAGRGRSRGPASGSPRSTAGAAGRQRHPAAAGACVAGAARR